MAVSQRQNQEETDPPKLPSLSVATSPPKAEAPLPPAVSNAEIQDTLQKINAKDFSFGGVLRALHDPTMSTKSDPLLQRELDEILVLLRKESRNRALRTRLCRWASFLFVIGWFVFALSRHDFSFNTLFFLYIPIGLLGMSTMASRQQQIAAMALSQCDDVRAIGPLSEALEFQERDIRPLASRALIRLLPRLQASDASLLSAAQRSCLNRALTGSNVALTLAILKAWEQVGDTAAIPAVQNLADRAEGISHVNPFLNPAPPSVTPEREGWRSRTAKAWQQFLDLLLGKKIEDIPEANILQLAKAAQECLPVLQQSLERRHIRSQLLRPAQEQQPPSDILLRPATPQASTDPPQQLLRPTDSL